MLVCGSSHAQVTTSYQMSEDGYTKVPLPFSFPYYGRTFTNSWMYDNGVISFLNPKSHNAVSPETRQPPLSLSQADGKYFIAALWANVSSTTSTAYTTTTDGTYMKYSWNNVSEYYRGGTRLSSFSSTIRPDGSVSTSYYSVNLKNSNVLAGAVGDPSEGEVYQTFNATRGTEIATASNWNYNLASPPVPPEVSDPCAKNALSSSSCPGFSAAIMRIMNTSLPMPTPMNATTVDDTANSTDDATGTSIGLSVIAKNRQREQNTASSAAQNAIASAEVSALASQQEAMMVVSSAGSASSSQTQTDIGTKINSSSAIKNSNDASNLLGSTDNNLMSYNNPLLDRTNPLNDYLDTTKTVAELTAVQQLPRSSVNQQVSANELAGGIDTAKMAKVPTGYDSYLNLTMKDSDFYAPQTVYRNQINVDNLRLLRQLTNDSKHQSMVEQQYRR